MIHFKVVHDRTTGVWHVYDNWKGEIARTYSTRQKARWGVKAFNEWGYLNDMEEKEEK
jgi:hypothetical protein